jgi:hypothetical protein
MPEHPDDRAQPSFLRVKEMADGHGIDEASVRSALTNTRKKAAVHRYKHPDESDYWPNDRDDVPRPIQERPILLWRSDDPAVLAYINPQPVVNPLLLSFDFLHEHYIVQGMTAAEIGRLTGHGNDVVTLCIERVVRPDGGRGLPIRKSSRPTKLEGLSMIEINGLLAQFGNHRAVARALKCSPMTLTRRIRRLETEANPPEALSA